MKKFFITKNRRLRSTPFASRIEKQGLKSYTIYNHMFLPTAFNSLEEDYLHLKKHVQIWDVSAQRAELVPADNVWRHAKLTRVDEELVDPGQVKAAPAGA